MAFQHLTVRDGLSQNTIMDVLQDSHGYIWLATENGLDRYDGYDLHSYQRNSVKDGELAIDDFGTGYSSLSYLKRFPLDVLKIDRAFIKDLETDSNDKALCRAMISMGHSLGLEVIGEGIETEYQLKFLSDAGCELAQGFLLDKPMSAAHFESKIDQPMRRFSLESTEPHSPRRNTYHATETTANNW